jgi:hypothetical protein
MSEIKGNWNVSNIFEARNKRIEAKVGVVLVTLTERGWNIIHYANLFSQMGSEKALYIYNTYYNMDVYNCCAVLNNLDARLNPTEHKYGIITRKKNKYDDNYLENRIELWANCIPTAISYYNKLKDDNEEFIEIITL